MRAFIYHDDRRTLSGLTCALAGRHQLMNAAVAVAAAVTLRDGGVAIGDDAMANGLAGVRWEGRLETLQERPRLLLDGAHNPAAARVLADYLIEEKARSGGRVVAVFGIMRDKAVGEVVAALRPAVDEWVATAPAMPRALPAGQVAAAIRAAGGAVTVEADPARAAADALARLSAGDCCCVTGSLYTVAAVRAHWLEQHRHEGVSPACRAAGG